MDVTPEADSQASAVPSADEIDTISSRRFSNSFRGWNPDEVRVHLIEVAETVRTMARRQGELERQLAEAEAAVRRADLTRLEPDEVSRVLGEETARVLRAARESAAEIVAKAEAQAELLASQAADDAARLRTEARDDAERLRVEAEETASAVRTAGAAHVEDLRAAAESELAEERTAMQDQLAAEREALHAEIAAQRAAAEEEAVGIRSAAETDADATRTEAAEYAERLRSEAEADVAQLRSTAEEEAREVAARAAAQVADSERLRDRVLADLAHKRRAARKHLEQLHAGRDRLLTAYQVILATTDQATAELDVVLADAKRDADQAARRIAAEPLPTPEEMLAELQEVRERDPSMGTVAPASDPATVDVDEESTGDPALTESGGPREPAAVDPVSAEVGDEPESAEDAPSDPPPEGTTADPALLDPQPIHLRQQRRGKRRHDPLGGEPLPDVPLMPVAAAAEFESVRVMSSAEAAEAIRDAAARPQEASGLTDEEAEPAPVQEPEPAPVQETEPAAVAEADPPAPLDAATPEPDRHATRGADQAPGEQAAQSPDSESVPEPHAGPVGATTGAAENRERRDSTSDQVTDIFARLRAERAREDDQDPAPRTPDIDRSGSPTSPDPTSGEPPATDSDPGREDQPGVPAPRPEPTSTVETPTGVTTTMPGPTPERLASLFERRDAAVDDSARLLSKHLKRRLSDQQSELLDELRRIDGPVTSAVLPTDFAEGWAGIVEENLAGAVQAGSSLVADLRPGTPTDVEVDLAGAVDELVETIAVPLRSRLERVLDEDVTEADDDAAVDERELADRVRACYREWRGARLASAVSDVCGRAFGLGVRAALPARLALHWYCSPGADPCSDCNDNRLAGGVADDEAFPTGQAVAPAHPGCTCLALPDLG